MDQTQGKAKPCVPSGDKEKRPALITLWELHQQQPGQEAASGNTAGWLPNARHGKTNHWEEEGGEETLQNPPTPPNTLPHTHTHQGLPEAAGGEGGQGG